MRILQIIFKRELAGYFATPLAYVFIVIFLVMNGIFTFDLGGFYVRGQADLMPFFSFHPWLYLFMIPAIAMGLWADERKTGTIELLMTLPVKLTDAVLGKFLAAWVLCGAALLLTFPIWITVNYLGDPDNGVIVAAYLGSWLMAGSFLAIGSCMSAMHRPTSWRPSIAPTRRACRLGRSLGVWGWRRARTRPRRSPSCAESHAQGCGSPWCLSAGSPIRASCKRVACEEDPCFNRLTPHENT